jgi:TonB family protein
MIIERARVPEAEMQYQNITSNWEDASVFAVFRSPFLLPSIILHLLLMFFVMRAVNLSLAKPAQDAPISVQLEDFKGSGTDIKSIGLAKGPGGPRPLPKLGTPVAPAPRTGKVDSGSAESSAPSPTVDPPAPVPAPVPLPGPKVLAANSRSEHVNASETAPDSLVRLPTKAGPTNLPGAAATDTALAQNSSTSGKAAEGAGIKGLAEGAQIPGALKGTGSGTGPFGVPGGSRTGSGLAGAGAGTDAGGGSPTGLKGTPSADYNQYFNQLKKRVQSVWKYPDGISGLQKVRIVFTLDRAGKLVQAEVLESSDSRLNASAVEAMRRASPFPPIPENLKHLANEPLRMEFTVEIRVRG